MLLLTFLLLSIFAVVSNMLNPEMFFVNAIISSMFVENSVKNASSVKKDK